MSEHELLIGAVLLGLFVLFLVVYRSEEEQNWTEEHLHQDYTPREFEELVSALWEDKGFTVELAEEGPDGGVDVAATKSGVSAAIEVKQYHPETNTVGRPVVQKVYAASNQYGHNKAVVATSSRFTGPAEDACDSLKCRSTSVELYDGAKLVEELEESSIEAPFEIEE